MSPLLTALVFFLVLILASATYYFWLRFRSAKKSLDACADSLQNIFKELEEPSAVMRILAQEPPEQELKRLQGFIFNRNQKAIVENEALHGLINGFPDGIVAITADYTVEVCNKAFCRLMNLSEVDQKGKKLFEVLRFHIAMQAAEDFFNKTDEKTSEIEFLIPNDKWIRLTMMHLSNARGMAGLFVVSDVTAIKRLENMRRDFVANVSHELRTPLTSIQGFVETLLGGASDDAAARAHFLELMRKDTERLSRLIEDLLVLSKIENPSQIFKKEKLNASYEIGEVLDLFKLRFSQKKINFKQQVEAGLDVHAERDQFRQVLINLLDNAAKYTSESGSVVLSAKKIGNSGIEIRVTDSGIGVQPENQEKIFQRFFREDKARSRETGGTGLGLSIVKHIMEVHHGRVHCEPGENGRGTSFVLFFPLA